jgi:hypothetical protein
MRTRHTGRIGRAAALAALGVSGALFAQSLNLRPGNYEMVTTADLNLPPEAAAHITPDMLAQMQQPHTSQHCITASDLAKARERLAGRQEDESCKLSDQSMSGNEVKFVMRCAHDTVHFDGTLGGDSYQATMLMTSERGRTTTVHLKARRIGDCPK